MPPSGHNEAFARALIDAQLRNAKWNLTDGRSVRFGYVLPDGTKADYVLCDRHGLALAVLEAKRASVDPISHNPVPRDRSLHSPPPDSSSPSKP